MNRVAAAVAAEKARRRSLQRQMHAAAAIRPRSHAALRTLAQHAAPPGPDLARAQLPLLGRQRSASEGQLEGLLESGRHVLGPDPTTPCPESEAPTAAQRLAAFAPSISDIDAPTADPFMVVDVRAACPGKGSVAQPATVPVVRGSAPPEAPALRQLRPRAAGSVSINGRGSSPRVHLPDPHLAAETVPAQPGAPAAGPVGVQETPRPLHADPSPLAWFSPSSDSTELQPHLGASLGNSTRTAGGGHGGCQVRRGAASAQPTRMRIHAVTPSFPPDSEEGKLAAPAAARPSPSAPSTPTARHLAQEGGTEGPKTPLRRGGLLSTAARFFLP